MIDGRVALQQRVLPSYRKLFLDRLAQACPDGLSVFAGPPRKAEAIETTIDLQSANYESARNVHLLWGRYYLCLQLNLMAWLKRWDPAILILEANARYPFNRLAIQWMVRRGRPVLGWGLGAPKPTGFFSSYRRQWRNRYLAGFDGLIAYSTQGADQYRQTGIAAHKIHVALNAVSPPPSNPPIRTKTADPLRLLFVGRLQKRKRLDLLMRACATIDAPPQLWIVGDGPYSSKLKEIAGRIYPDTKFFGAIHGEDLKPIYSQADLFVLPGTGGLALQQAMANGLAVLAADGDGTQRDLIGKENGWLVKPDDIHDLRKTLVEALSDRGRLVTFGKASYQIVLQRANSDVMAREFVRAINKIAGAER